ncbi:MAG TPA: phosphohistidine phosphatase SixA [Terriglobia bacterium]|jgi:phosphohistidine phosphatase
MRVYLVQHGKAKSAEDDPNRGLSDEGRNEVMQVVEFLSALRITVSLIQHSGKARAEETAHLFAEGIRCTSGPIHVQGLEPNDDPSLMANFLKVYTDDVLIVGHLPHLERLISLLLTGAPDLRPIALRNGGVVCLQKDTGGIWSILWAIVPELLRTPTLLAA